MAKKAREIESWQELNDYLRGCSEEEAKALLEAEKKGSKRRMYLMRIHSRVNKTRADRERGELKEVAS